MKRLLAACTALCVLFAASAFAQSETQIGVTAAVNPEATGTPPVSDTRVLQVGTDMVADERVTTTASGQVQMLFLDESALTIGPNSDVVLDRFVYDPDTKTGELVLAATKGVFRLVGGKISKQTPVVLETPTATIGIRGGIAIIKVDENPGTEATFLFGDGMTVTSGGETVEVTRPGYTVFVPEAGQPPSAPVPATQAQLSDAVNALEGESEPAGEESEGADVPRDSDVAASGLGEAGSEIAPTDIAPGGAEPTVTIEVGGVDDDVADASQDQGAGGGGISAGVDVSLFEGRFIRSLTRSDGAEPSGNIVENPALSNGRFTGSTFTGAFDLSLPGTTGSFAVSSFSPFDNVTGTGFLTSDSKFVFYELTESTDSTKRNLAYAGVPVTTVPTSGVYFFSVQDDFLLDSTVPFLRNVAGGSLIPGEAESKADAAIVWGTGATASTAIAGSAQRAFGHRTIVISGQGTSQQSAAGFVSGAVLLDSANSNAPFIDAFFYGSARLNTAQQSFVSDGDVGTLDASVAGDGTAHFFGPGTPDNFVLLSLNNTTSTNFAGTELEQDFGATTVFYTPFSPVLRNISETLDTRTTQTLRGYTGGAIQTISSTGSLLATALFLNATGSPADVIVKTSAETNKVQADIDVTQAFTATSLDAFGLTPDVLNNDFGDLDIGAFGDASNTTGDSIFIDDESFGGGLDQAASFTGSNPAIESEGAFVTVGDASEFSNGFLPSGVTVCQCTFLTWGFWSADIGRSSGVDEQVHLANWVAGDIPDASSLPVSGIATFAGQAIGTKLDASNNVFQAIGNFAMSYDFASPTSSTGTITQFDSDTFNLAVSNASTTGTLHFSGDITGTGVTAGASSSFVGSFVQGGGDVTAEMEGHFRVLKDAGDKISGIYAADKQ